MRRLGLLLSMTCWGVAASLCLAQPVGTSITADHKEVGRVQTWIEKYDQALGVVSQLRRSQLSGIECNGVCYFPNSSRPVSWKCEPDKKCALHCTVNPPVGGCV
jgi:hypothetical protein